MIEKQELLNFDRAKLELFFTSIGEKSFRATQIIKWVHQLGVTDFALMTNLSLKLRQALQETFTITLPEVVQQSTSLDGTHKWLYRLADGNLIETVFIPEEGRGTLCVSSQVGCPLQCKFCATGGQGFKRNLTAAEIVGQLWLAVWQLTGDKVVLDSTTKKRAITNVVIMGMGEPLLNFDNVLCSTNLMLDDFAYGISKYRVTLSTAGIIPEMLKLREVSEVSLAVSLHAPEDELRSSIMPVNKKYPLAELIQVCTDYYLDPRRKITIEYVMLAGVNDSVAHARKLVKLLNKVKCKVNLIVFNAFPQAKYSASTDADLEAFREVLIAADINTITRKTRGADIAAACGQLAGISS